jgi:hypothetical protein
MSSFVSYGMFPSDPLRFFAGSFAGSCDLPPVCVRSDGILLAAHSSSAEQGVSFPRRRDEP